MSISKFLKNLYSTLFATRTRTILSSMGMWGLVVIPVAGMALLQPSQPEQQEAQTQQIGAPGGQAWAWGRNNIGQLGDGTTTDRNSPVQVSSLSGITTVAGGERHSLALKNDGTAWAWGHNDHGQLGDGTTTYSNTPVQVSNLSGVTAIAAGLEHSLAVTDTTAPNVTSTVPPGANATGVAPGANVTATFTEAMDARTTDGDPSTIDGTTFKLMKAGTTTAIGAVVSYNATARKAILNPNSNLQRGTKYKAVVTTGAQDVAGNRLDQNSSTTGLQQKVWFFEIAD